MKRHLPFVSIRKNISTCWHLGNSFMRLNWNGISCTRKPAPMSGSRRRIGNTTFLVASQSPAPQVTCTCTVPAPNTAHEHK